jgi:hypothetical protein
MATVRESQELVQRPSAVVAPLTLGLTDCFVLLLSLILMMISAIAPSAERSPK